MDDNCSNQVAKQTTNSVVKQTPACIGRFAPSPSGPLHFGSLVAAIASYMVAKSNGGRWLVRMEDLDPPREVAGAAQQILTSLESFGLYWDGEVVYQSQRQSLYQQKLEELIRQKIVYYCSCSRRAIENRNQAVYDGHCRGQLKADRLNSQAVRIMFAGGFECFDDQLCGHCQFYSKADKQDFIIKRRDGLFAYQLAVVCDDIEQGVDHLVRGMDIIDSTPRQNYLYHCFAKAPPIYYHIPLVLDGAGRKLSKSSGAPRLNENNKTDLLLKAFSHLGQKVDAAMLDADSEELIAYFEKHWQTELIK
ncbi:MAG: tRNA glutamyl-Q(34) synthetase GluQRS [Enterobacterales bacterium]|nr:tRNA glutamyl-Q(34) synthetase GluQRS [Enterobacterales bacterium]